MTFTKERLEQLIRAIDSESYDEEEIVGWVNSDEILELARIALAALTAGMEQEPVAYMQIDGDEIEYNGHNEFSGGGKGVPLYAAPQLPQPVEPEITSEELDDELLEQLIDFRRDTLNYHKKEGNRVQTVMHGVVLRAMLELQERRAAMLQGAEPVLEWIPCSERMPPCFTGIIVAAPWPSAPDGYAMKWATNCPWHPDADENGWLIPGASWKPTHWMPLPAAPQQEVKK